MFDNNRTKLFLAVTKLSYNGLMDKPVSHADFPQSHFFVLIFSSTTYCCPWKSTMTSVRVRSRVSAFV